MNTRKGNWIQTYTGRRFYPLDPRPEEIDPLDIAQALSHQCRFSGHTSRHYSVLEHSYRMATFLPSPFVAYALLHDAAEAYLVDIPRPLKHSPEFNFYRQAENHLLSVILFRFGLDPVIPEKIDLADKAMLHHEYRYFFQHHLPEWDKFQHYADVVPELEQQVFFHYAGHPDFWRFRWVTLLRDTIGDSCYYGHHLTLEQAV